MVDVDHFKPYNDAFGHPAGDLCLMEVALTMQQVVGRSPDLLTRIGGEDFAVLLPATDGAGALAVAERIREAVLTRALPHPHGEADGLVTVSLGVATLIPASASRPEDLVARADAALYRAKAAGRNTVRVEN